MLLAGLWRIVIAVELPAISRDGVVFCWYARDLGRQGVAYLRAPEAQQHPLFPILILGAQRGARLLGASDSPMTWQRSGQAVCWLGGMAVVGLAGALARRLIRRLELPLDEDATVIVAMLVAALLDLNVWLSADVMSDQVHLVFYLAAVWLLLKLDSVPAALGCGLLSGLAFVTRQEGFVPVLAGVVVLGIQGRQIAWRKQGPRVAALVCGFLVCAAPYWSAVGRFTTKKDPRDLFSKREVAARESRVEAIQASAVIGGGVPCFGRLPHFHVGHGGPTLQQVPVIGPTMAKLETVNLSWYTLLPNAFYTLLRAGRVIVPLLALLPLLNLRKRLLAPALVGLTSCLAGHFLLTLLLLSRYGYLSPRHMLVIAALLVPLAAMFLGRIWQLMRQRGRPWVGGLVVAVCLLPLAAYALRVPNQKDRFLMDASRWLVAHDPDLASKRLLGGSSTRRIAFYADMRWEGWSEDQTDYDGLCGQIRAAGAGYFAIELAARGATANQFERAGNRELVDKLLADAQTTPYLKFVHLQPGPDAGELHLFELQPGAP